MLHCYLSYWDAFYLCACLYSLNELQRLRIDWFLVNSWSAHYCSANWLRARKCKQTSQHEKSYKMTVICHFSRRGLKNRLHSAASSLYDTPSSSSTTGVASAVLGWVLFVRWKVIFLFLISLNIDNFRTFRLITWLFRDI